MSSVPEEVLVERKQLDCVKMTFLILLYISTEKNWVSGVCDLQLPLDPGRRTLNQPRPGTSGRIL